MKTGMKAEERNELEALRAEVLRTDTSREEWEAAWTAYQQRRVMLEAIGRIRLERDLQHLAST